jgi:Tfp pilus assembly protein PilP
MRVAKLSRTLLLLALPAVPAACALAQDHPNVQPSAVRDQLMKQPSSAAQSQPATPVKAPAPPKSPVQAPAKENPSAKTPPPAIPAKSPAPAKAPAKEMAQAPPTKSPAPSKAPEKAPVKAAEKAPVKEATQTPVAKSPAPAKAPEKAPAKAPAQAAQAPAAKQPVEKPAEQKTSVARRDPFETLLNNSKASAGPPVNLPPGKAGLQVGTLRINGIVRGSGGVIAIVSNPQQRVYFLREGDKLYDGTVEHITLEAITFQEFGKDAFGKPLERQVTKRLYPSPGEQQ